MNKHQQNLSTRVTALESDMADVKTGVKAILDHLRGVEAPVQPQALTAPVVVGEVVETKPAKAKKGKKAKARKTEARKAPANGTIEGKRCLTRKNRHMFLADHEWARSLPAAQRSVVALAEAVLAGAPLAGNWAIGPRTTERLTGEAPTVEVVVAETTAKATAKVYRRANGTVAPKGEWAMRAALEAQGLSRSDVDEKVAVALSILA